jgi:hypothetical protein
MHHGRRIPTRQQGREFLTQDVGGFEKTFGIQVLIERAVERTWNVPGHRVQRLHLPPVTRCSTSINHSLAFKPYVLRDGLGVRQRQQGWPQGQLGGRSGRGRCAVYSATRSLPGLQASVQDCRLVVSHPFKHPPEAATVVGTLSVIHHDLHVWRQTLLTQPIRKAFSGRQGVTAAVDCQGDVVGAQITL